MRETREERLRCTCRPGRDYDGSEFGPCEACEAADDATRALAGIQRDAARWRISQVRYPRMMDDPFGYFAVDNSDDGYFSVGIQPHPVSRGTSINGCILGKGKTEADAIDAMFLALDALVDAGHQLAPEIEGPRALAALSRSKSED